MGYELTNSAGRIHEWKVLGWSHLLNLAQECGWSARGTKAAADSEPGWDGNYFQNAGQRVTADDAAALAGALERLLGDPEREVVAASVAGRMERVVFDTAISPSSDARDVLRYPLEYMRGMLGHFGQDSIGAWKFSPNADAYLRQFVEFCRGGGFTIA